MKDNGRVLFEFHLKFWNTSLSIPSSKRHLLFSLTHLKADRGNQICFCFCSLALERILTWFCFFWVGWLQGYIKLEAQIE